MTSPGNFSPLSQISPNSARRKTDHGICLTWLPILTAAAVNQCFKRKYPVRNLTNSLRLILRKRFGTEFSIPDDIDESTRKRNWRKMVAKCRKNIRNFNSKTVKTARKTKPSSVPHPSSADPKGLCEDCRSNNTCSYARPEGGVWHCPAYC